MKTYRVINTENDHGEIHEYNITVDINDNGHEVITLTRTFNNNWSQHVRGEELIKIIDTGNKMVFPKKMFSGDVGYDSFAELHIIMSFINKSSSMPVYKGRIEEVTSKAFEI